MSRCSLSHSVFKRKPPDLNKSFSVRRRHDQQGANTSRFGMNACFHVRNLLSIRSAIETDANNVVAYSPRAKHIFSWLQLCVADSQWRLCKKEVRILSFRRVACGDHDDARDESIFAVSHSGGRAKFCFDILRYHRSPLRNYPAKFRCRGRAPARGADTCEPSHLAKQQTRDNQD